MRNLKKYLVRALTLLAGLMLLLIGALAAAQDVSLTTLWQRGDYTALRAALNAQGTTSRLNSPGLAEAARAAEEAGEYRTAAELYGAYARQLPAGNPDAYREATRRQWLCADQAGDSGWRTDAAAQVRELLADPAGGQTHQLALELEAILTEIETGRLEAGVELRKLASSEVTLRSAKLAVDAAAALRDDKARIAACKSVIADYPGNYWLHMAYRLWLFSASRQGDKSALGAAADAYLAAYPNSALAQGAVSRYFLEADLQQEKGYQAALQSVALYEKQLGILGTSDLARVQQHSLGQAGVPRGDWLPPSEREVFIEYLGSRYNLGRYELSRGQRKAALAMVEPVIALSPFSVDEEASLAPFYLIAGQAHDSLGHWPEAYRNYLGALVSSDPQGRYSLQAEPALKKVSGYLTDREKQAELARYLPPGSPPLPSFTDITVPAGLTAISASRASWADVDGDGDPDLLLDGSKLLLNDGRNGFKDASSLWGIGAGGKRGRFSGGLGEDQTTSKSSSRGAVFGDVDNDGDLDFFAFGSGKDGDLLWRNEGGSFSDVTSISGPLSDAESSESACWVDFDRDGWLDLFVGGFGRGTAGSGSAGEHASGHDRLLHSLNRGGSFEEVSLSASGLSREFGGAAASSSLSADLNSDGFADIYSAGRYGSEDAVWLGGADGSFSAAGRAIGYSGMAPPLLLASASDGSRVYAASRFGDTFGAALADFNNDGRLDLLSASRADGADLARSATLQLCLGRGDEAARDLRAELGIKTEQDGAGVCTADFNNDGNMDFFVCAAGEGHRSSLYLNSGKGSFIDVTYLAAARCYNAYGCACADVDSDGDLDLLACGPRGVRLLRNDSPEQGFITLRLAGARSGPSNAAGIGAVITVTSGPVKQTRVVQSSGALGCGDDLLQCIGLGSYAGLAAVSVHFPDGKVVSSPEGVRPGTRWLVDEEAGFSPLPLPGAITPPKPKLLENKPQAQPQRPTDTQRPIGPSRGGR